MPLFQDRELPDSENLSVTVILPAFFSKIIVKLKLLAAGWVMDLMIH